MLQLHMLHTTLEGCFFAGASSGMPWKRLEWKTKQMIVTPVLPSPEARGGNFSTKSINKKHVNG